MQSPLSSKHPRCALPLTLIIVVSALHAPHQTLLKIILLCSLDSFAHNFEAVGVNFGIWIMVILNIQLRQIFHRFSTHSNHARLVFLHSGFKNWRYYALKNDYNDQVTTCNLKPIA
jgi:hypothetical protein